MEFKDVVDALKFGIIVSPAIVGYVFYRILKADHKAKKSAATYAKLYTDAVVLDKPDCCGK